MHHEIHQSAIVLFRCVPGRRHIGKREDPGDVVDYFTTLSQSHSRAHGQLKYAQSVAVESKRFNIHIFIIY